MGLERRSRAVHGRFEVNGSGEEPRDRSKQKKLKSFEISKRLIYGASVEGPSERRSAGRGRREHRRVRRR